MTSIEETLHNMNKTLVINALNPRAVLRVGVVYEPPYSNYCALDPICRHRGFGVDAAVMICRELQLRCEFRWYERPDYGRMDENGSWIGMVRAIMDGEYDTSLPVFTPRFDRQQVVDFSQALFYYGIVLMTRQPFQSERFDASAAKSLQWPVWCAFLGSFVCLQLLMILASAYGGVESGSGRVVALFWAIITLFFSSAYTSVLYSTKMAARTDLPFVDMESLIGCVVDRKCRLIAPSLSYSALLDVINSSSSNSQRLRKYMTFDDIVISPEHRIAERILMQNDTYLTMIGTTPMFNEITERNRNCRFYVVTTPYVDVNGFPLRKRSRFRRMFDAAASGFQSTGMDTAIKSEYRIDDDPCQKMQSKFGESATEPLRMRKVYVTVVTLAAGMIAAVGVGIGECFGRKTGHSR